MHDPYMDLFERRLERIARARERARAPARRRGHKMVVARAAPRRHAFPRGTMLLAFTLSVTMSKGAALASLGAEDYAARLAALQQGSAWQSAAAILMAPDAASREAARWLGALLR